MAEESRPAEPKQPTKPSEQASGGEHPLRRRILSLPGFLATTIAAAGISWGVNYAATDATVSSLPPVTVSVQTDPAMIPYFEARGQYAVLPAGGRDVGSPGSGCLGFHHWVVRNGGASTPVLAQIVVQNQTPQPVFISDMRVRVLRRLPKLAGPVVACPSAGAAAFRPIEINLDATPPTVMYENGGRNHPFGFTLTSGETEVFEITATTQRAHYVFDIELDLLVGGKPETIQVKDHGRPFQATAPELQKDYWSWDYQSTWTQENRAGNTIRTLPAGRPFPAGA